MSMNLQLSPAGRARRMDLSTLPATHVDKGSKAQGVFLIVFASLWGGAPTALLIAALAAGKFEPGLLLLLLFTVVGLGLLLGGIQSLFRSTTTTLDRDSVTVLRKSLCGDRQWTEPLAAYEGVQSRGEYHSGGKNRSSYTLYIVELRHPDPKKAVRLYESRSDADLRAIWEDSCRKLGMPAVELSEGHLVRREIADFDKSLKDMVREGKVKVEFDPSKPPPAALSVRADGDVLELTLLRKKSSAVGIGIGLLVPAVFMYIGFFVKSGPVAMGVVGAVFFALVAAGCVWSRIAREQIRIGKDEIRTRQQTPWGVVEGRSVRAADVEGVKIGRKDERGLAAVLLETDAGTVAIGSGLAADALEWLKNCIMRVIAA